MVECVGRVIRSKRIPTVFASTEGASGFSLELVGYNENYTRFFGSL